MSDVRPDRPGVDDPGPGRRLAVDVGAVRVGVALSDPAPILASPLVTLSRDADTDRDLEELARLVAEHDVVEVIVGLPRTLADRHGT
ncbi:pre-16S rRNA-processing nuclease YqgF, partial [Klebsiella pneumoniae]